MHRLYIIALSTIFIFCPIYSGVLFAGVINDGFDTDRMIESRYFTIFIEDDVDLYELTASLTLPPNIKAIIRKPVTFSEYPTISDQFDISFLAVSEIMDIHLRKFGCKVKICRDSQRLSEIADRLFGTKMQTGGFYVASINTLYIDAESVDIYILGHELSHAVQCHYFVVPPPVKIQEILSGYVEYELRKYTDSMPY